MANHKMNCQELVELVTDYFEGVLPPAERERFETHLSACSGCTAYLEQMRTVMRLTGRLTEDDVQPPARDELLALFRTWKTRKL